MKVAVVGATGVVGETILRVLDERKLPIGKPGLFASRERDGILATTDEALEPYDVVFFASSEDASERYVPAIAARGAFAIDNSSTYRMRADIPLIVPEVNADAARPEDRIYPVGNCTAIVLTVALAPIRDVAGLKTVRVATYQAASGAGRAGLDELLAGERAIAAGEAEPVHKVFPANLARNVVPQVGSFDDEGFTGEERKVAEETRKVLGLPHLRVIATTVRVPVRTAHSEVIFIETERKTSVAELSAAFAKAKGVAFHPTGIVTPRDVEGTDIVHVARLRDEDGEGYRFALWAVGDQLRKGAATNAVQILELLTAKGYIQR